MKSSVNNGHLRISLRLTAMVSALCEQMHELFFRGWENLLHIGICSAGSYLALFAFIRISGKRTMSKLTAVDFVVSVTLGSTLSWMILAQVSVSEGVLAVMVIVGLQYLLAKVAHKSPILETVINSQPTLLFYNGCFLDATLSKECVTEEEIYAAVREFRIESMDEVRAVVMELNGELTVVQRGEIREHTSLDDLNLPE